MWEYALVLLRDCRDQQYLLLCGHQHAKGVCGTMHWLFFGMMGGLTVETDVIRNNAAIILRMGNVATSTGTFLA